MTSTAFSTLPVRHYLNELREDISALEKTMQVFFQAHYPDLTKAERVETLRLTHKLAGLRAVRAEEDRVRHLQENMYGESRTWEAKNNAYHWTSLEFLELFNELGLYLFRLERQERSPSGSAHRKEVQTSVMTFLPI